MDESESDYHNFSQPSSNHRLPTLNGAQALLDVIEKHKPISTNLPTLDSILHESSTAIELDGGVSRGGVIEIYGAPGSGKTHFAIQLTANVLRGDESARVVWIDTSSKLAYPRLRNFLDVPQSKVDGDASQTTESMTEDEISSMEERFGHLYVSSFTHLLSILLHPTRKFIPEETTLLVIDDFSKVVMNGLPQDERFGGTGPREGKQPLSRDDILTKSVAVRRAAMLSAISSGLARLAATYSVAVVVSNRATSNRKSGSKIATMKSVLGTQQWNENVAARIVLYRIFWPTIEWSSLDKEGKAKQRRRERHALRVAEVERIDGKDVLVEGVRFVILNNCIHAVDPPRTIGATGVILPSSPPTPTEDQEAAMGNLDLEDAMDNDDQSLQMPEDVPPCSILHASSQAMKRKIGEIADSEDEAELDTRSQSKSRSTVESLKGFLPSSQISMDGKEPGVSALESDRSWPAARHVDEDPDEMLLKD